MLAIKDVLLSRYIQLAPSHKGKGRIVGYWMAHRDRSRSRYATLPGGSTILCDMSCDYDAMVFLGQEEQTELRWLIGRLQPGDLFIDCGANIGLWTLVAAARVGESGHIVSYEPNPSTVKRLKANIRRNNMENIVSVIEAAAGSTTGLARFDAGAAHNLGHLDGSGDLVVPVVTLDRTVTVTGRVAGVKLDVEGGELAALIGAERLISEHRPWLIVEFNTAISGTNCIDEWDVYQYLRSAGYTAFESGSSGRWLTPVERGWSIAGYRNILFEP